ncbi:MAG: hypothetical protein Q4B67_04925 [Eubacteriales bacterium]|nr:hypothetical protein [Eubacteriales bacterium]
MNRNKTADNNGLSLASVLVGIFSILFSILFFVSVPLAILSIAFACLSRGAYRMNGQAKAGIWLSIIGMLMTAMLTFLIASFAVKYFSVFNINDMLFNIGSFLRQFGIGGF